MRGEGISTRDTLFLHSQCDRCNDCRVWQAGCIKVQDANILFVGFVIAQVERPCCRIARSADVAVLTRFQDPAIIRSHGFEADRDRVRKRFIYRVHLPCRKVPIPCPHSSKGLTPCIEEAVIIDHIQPESPISRTRIDMNCIRGTRNKPDAGDRRAVRRDGSVRRDGVPDAADEAELRDRGGRQDRQVQVKH